MLPREFRPVHDQFKESQGRMPLDMLLVKLTAYVSTCTSTPDISEKQYPVGFRVLKTER